jgi:hypothetical protein
MTFQKKLCPNRDGQPRVEELDVLPCATGSQDGFGYVREKKCFLSKPVDSPTPAANQVEMNGMHEISCMPQVSPITVRSML